MPMNTNSLSADIILAAVNASSDGILITDAQQPDNPIIFANNAFYSLTGYSEAEVIGHNCRFLQGEQTRKANVAALSAAVRENRALRVTLVNYKKDGTLFHNELSVSPVLNEKDIVSHYIGVQHDVTNEINQIQELEEEKALTEKLNNLLLKHENACNLKKYI